jgi:hypothetical protein
MHTLEKIPRPLFRGISSHFIWGEENRKGWTRNRGKLRKKKEDRKGNIEVKIVKLQCVIWDEEKCG